MPEELALLPPMSTIREALTAFGWHARSTCCKRLAGLRAVKGADTPVTRQLHSCSRRSSSGRNRESMLSRGGVSRSKWLLIGYRGTRNDRR